MPERPSMLWTYADGVLVVVHTAQVPTDDAWNAHCALIERVRRELRAVVVYADGGGPSSKQRQEMRRALQGAIPPVAILTNSVLVRGIVTSLNWFLSNHMVA